MYSLYSVASIFPFCNLLNWAFIIHVALSTAVSLLSNLLALLPAFNHCFSPKLSHILPENNKVLLLHLSGPLSVTSSFTASFSVTVLS